MKRVRITFDNGVYQVDRWKRYSVWAPLGTFTLGQLERVMLCAQGEFTSLNELAAMDLGALPEVKFPTCPICEYQTKRFGGGIAVCEHLAKGIPEAKGERP